MCMGNNSVVGDVVTDVIGAVADYASGGSLTPYLAATIAGQATSAYAQNQVLKKQNDDAAAGIIKQGQIQKSAEDTTAATTAKIASSTPAQQTATQLASFQKALQQSAPEQGSASPNVPGASKAYKATQATAGASAQDYLSKIAGSAAVTEGTQLERVQEGQVLGATATQLGGLQQQSNEQSYLTKLQIQSAQANPWVTALGSVLKGVGAAGSIYAGGVGAASSSSTGLAGAAASYADQPIAAANYGNQAVNAFQAGGTGQAAVNAFTAG